jgi:hypothetical protein
VRSVFQRTVMLATNPERSELIFLPLTVSLSQFTLLTIKHRTSQFLALFGGPSWSHLATPARVQAYGLSSVLALNEGVPRAMDHHSSGCLPAEKFPTSASHRQDRGATTLLNFHPPFPRARRRDVHQEESAAYGDGSARRAH